MDLDHLTTRRDRVAGGVLGLSHGQYRLRRSPAQWREACRAVVAAGRLRL